MKINFDFLKYNHFSYEHRAKIYANTKKNFDYLLEQKSLNDVEMNSDYTSDNDEMEGFQLNII